MDLFVAKYQKKQKMKSLDFEMQRTSRNIRVSDSLLDVVDVPVLFTSRVNVITDVRCERFGCVDILRKPPIGNLILEEKRE